MAVIDRFPSLRGLVVDAETSNQSSGERSLHLAAAAADLTSFRGSEHLLRAVPLNTIMEGGGRIFKSSHGDCDTYALSTEVHRIGYFISHNWTVHRASKFVSLAFKFNMKFAMLTGLLVALLGLVLSLSGAVPYVKTTDGRQASILCRLVMVPSVVLSLLFGRSLRRCCRCCRCFRRGRHCWSRAPAGKSGVAAVDDSGRGGGRTDSSMSSHDASNHSKRNSKKTSVRFSDGYDDGSSNSTVASPTQTSFPSHSEGGVETGGDDRSSGSSGDGGLGWSPSVFLDKVCINQADPVLQQAGIRKLGAFLRASDRMLVLYSSVYLRRLWTVYEVASFVSLHDMSNLELLPVVLSWAFLLVVCDQLLAMAVDLYHITDEAIYIANFVGAFTYVCATRLWAITKVEIEENLHNFSAFDAECAVESDREIVHSNIVSLMKASKRVAKTATRKETLEAFSEEVRVTLSRKLEDLFGTSAFTWKAYVVLDLTMLLPGFVDDWAAIGAGEPWRQVTSDHCFDPFWILLGIPMWFACTECLNSRLLHLTGIKHLLYIFVVNLLVAGLANTIMKNMALVARLSKEDDILLISLLLSQAFLVAIAYFLAWRWAMRIRRTRQQLANECPYSGYSSEANSIISKLSSQAVRDSSRGSLDLVLDLDEEDEEEEEEEEESIESSMSSSVLFPNLGESGGGTTAASPTSSGKATRLDVEAPVLGSSSSSPAKTKAGDEDLPKSISSAVAAPAATAASFATAADKGQALTSAVKPPLQLSTITNDISNINNEEEDENNKEEEEKEAAEEEEEYWARAFPTSDYLVKDGAARAVAV